MTTQTTRVFGKIRDVSEGRVTFANILPVFRGNRMTRAAGELLGYGMSCVRKLRVIDFWFGWTLRLCERRCRGRFCGSSAPDTLPCATTNKSDIAARLTIARVTELYLQAPARFTSGKAALAAKCL